MISLAAIAAAAAEEAGHEAAKTGLFFSNTSFWVLLSFLIVVGAFFRFDLHKKMAAALDSRANRIADEINEARKMREEAQELLAQYQRRQREAESEAAAIIEQAKKDAKLMAVEARDKINAQMERRAKAAEEKIARAEAQALSEVRGKAADVAIAAARDIIRERMDSGAQKTFIDKSIADLRGKLN